MPVSLLYSVKHPTPVLSLLVVLNTIAPAPFAVFLVPAVFRMSAATPLAVFAAPSVKSQDSSAKPSVIAGGGIAEKAIPAKGTVSDPASCFFRAFGPSAVVNPGLPPARWWTAVIDVSRDPASVRTNGLRNH